MSVTWLVIIFILFLMCFIAGWGIIWSDYRDGLILLIVAVVLAAIFLIGLITSSDFNSSKENETKQVAVVEHKADDF